MELDAIAGSIDLVHASDGDEQDLIARARTDRRAFAVLYRRHYGDVARYVFRRTGDPHLTDDIVADVFLIALRTLARFRFRGVPIRFWFLRIATNRLNRWARRERRRATKRLETDPIDSRAAESTAVLTREEARFALLSLAAKHQTVLALHYLEGMPVAQIAMTLGCRAGTVKSRLSRGREALRRRLSRRRS